MRRIIIKLSLSHCQEQKKLRHNILNTSILNTSSEDNGYHYKDYIEDIILGLYLQGAILLPEYKYLRANNNKVYMIQ